MAKRGSPSSYTYGVCLLSSIALNILLVLNLCLDGREWNQLSWSQAAAAEAEAEAVASITCSGNGRAFLDGLQGDDGNPVCECNMCFQGPDCSEFVSDCPADVDSGDPLFLEPFWMQNAASSALLVAGWHRMSYSFPDHTYLSQQLIIYIRRVHDIAKNAVTDGKYIVFGVGSTQVISAAVFALSSQNASSPSKVVATTPYYPLYKEQTEYFQTAHFEFEGEASLVKNNSDCLDVIELVTSPNNPDCQLRKAVLRGPSVRTVYDHAYYWPHFTPLPAPADEDVMIFTISKLTGHAGSRLGWAIVRDKNVYERMRAYIKEAEMGVSRDTQLRALKLLRVVVSEGNGREIFDFGYKTMLDRWKRLNQIMSASRRFNLQQHAPQYCNYLDRVKDPSPAYGWLRCEYEEDADCMQVLEAANIIGRKGNKFNVENRYVRLSLLKRQQDFELLLYKLKELVKKEESAAEAM